MQHNAGIGEDVDNDNSDDDDDGDDGVDDDDKSWCYIHRCSVVVVMEKSEPCLQTICI